MVFTEGHQWGKRGDFEVPFKLFQDFYSSQDNWVGGDFSRVCI